MIRLSLQFLHELWRRYRAGCLPALGCFIALFAGCAVGPDYRPPSSRVPDRWGAAPGEGIAAGEVNVVRWWELFGDPRLQRLVEQAVRTNKDLKMAEARVRESRAQWRVAGTVRWPEVDLSGSYSSMRQSENAPSSAGRQYDLFQAGFDAAWEVDLFGGVQHSVEAVMARVQASEEDRRDALVTLTAEVAANYLALRGGQHRLAIARENIRTQRDTVDLTRGRFQAGLGSRLEVVQAEALLAGTEAKVPQLEASVRQSVHRLGVLLGRNPDTLLEELLPPTAIPSVPHEVPVGLPSDLLHRRPDIRRAERQLAAATADVGVATADLFPRFSLTGLLGLQTSAASDLLKGESRFWSYGPELRWPVFDAGRARAVIQVQTARQEQALAYYEKTVLVALEETENAMVRYAKARSAGEALDRAVASTQQSADIALELYRKGLADFLNVLQSQQALYQVQDQLVKSRQEVSTDLAALFKALGGGWDIEAEPADSPAASHPVAGTPGKKLSTVPIQEWDDKDRN